MLVEGHESLVEEGRSGGWLDLLDQGLRVQLVVGLWLLSLAQQGRQVLLQQTGLLLVLGLLLLLDFNYLQGLSDFDAVSVDCLHTQDV